MKRKAFTLAEALIALAIVAIVAGIMASMINRFKPDANKVIYLRNYDALVEVVKHLTNSTAFYPLYNSVEDRIAYRGVIYNNYPLYNTVEVEVNGTGVSGTQKFCELLAASLNVNPDSVACGNDNLDGNAASFTTKTGEDYIIKTTVEDPDDEGKGTYVTEILLDIDGLANGNNATFDTNSNDPDRFTFVVYSAGQVYATDNKGLGYLTTRSSWRKGDNPDVADFSYSGEQEDLEQFDLEYLPGMEPQLPE